MSYTFTNKPFVWTKAGVNPKEAEIVLGLQGGMALPAAFVNRQWNATYLVLQEMIEAVESGLIGSGLDPKVVIENSIEVGQEHEAAGDGYIVGGYKNRANAYNTVFGKMCKTPTAAALDSNVGDLFVIGGGISSGARSNALRVTAGGDVMGVKAYASTGADYAELFEYADSNTNNEDRRGLFVTLDGEKIRLANANDDYILGVISATPSIIGDANTDDWHGKYETDVFGARILENGAYKLADGFNESLDDNYTSRLDRQEWGVVGLLGKLIVVDDGTCEANGYCYSSENGIATASETGYRVLSRIDENHIRVLVK